MIINPEELVGCKKRTVALVDYLNNYAKEKYGTNLIITSGAFGRKTGHHADGDAIDFNFQDVHSFKIVTELFKLFLGQNGVFEGLKEFEVCAGWNAEGKPIHHIHLAYGNETSLEFFTGVYN